jgi:hypothetical protein
MHYTFILIFTSHAYLCFNILWSLARIAANTIHGRKAAKTGKQQGRHINESRFSQKADDERTPAPRAASMVSLSNGTEFENATKPTFLLFVLIF